MTLPSAAPGQPSAAPGQPGAAPEQPGATSERSTAPADQPVRTLLNAADLARTVDRIAHQVLEKTGGARDAVLLGIPTRGAPLARRLARRRAGC